jgi:hypothetical protein
MIGKKEVLEILPPGCSWWQYPKPLLCEKRVGETQGIRGTKGFAVSSINKAYRRNPTGL